METTMYIHVSTILTVLLVLHFVRLTIDFSTYRHVYIFYQIKPKITAHLQVIKELPKRS